MNGRILLFSMILVAANVASAAKYERTLEGNTKIQSSAPQQRLKASWSGDRDENGYATGPGTLTWFRMQKTWETGSLLPSVKYIEVSQYSGKMVEGKLEGSVVSTDTNGNTYHAKFEDGRKTTAWVAGSGSSKKQSEESGSRPKVVQASAEPPPPAEAPPPTPKIEHHVAEKQPSPAPVFEKQSSPAAAKEVSATHTADPAATPERTEESLRSLAMPPSSLRVASLNSTPPPAESGATETAKGVEPAPASADAPASPSVSVNDDDARAVAALDSEYQSAVKTNDAATIDRILADDFTLVRSAGRNVSKSELVKQARDKQAKYERHEVEDGTQKVRVWHDTAVVTETVWIKGIEDGKPVDEKMSLTATYARTPNGWRYVAAQASSPAK